MGFQKITAAVLDNGGKLWYNSLSNRARRLLSEQLFGLRNNHLTVGKQGGYLFLFTAFEPVK